MKEYERSFITILFEGDAVRRSVFFSSMCTSFSIASLLLLGAGCTHEKFHTITPQETQSTYSPYLGPKVTLALGKFENRSPYMRGIFSDGTDRLGAQAQQILKTHLSQSNRFVVVDRINMDELSQEAKIAGRKQKLTSGDIVVTGAVTEFGKKEIGHRALVGIISNSKTQVAYAKVSLSVINVHTSEILGSYQGAGEYELSATEVLGFGARAGQDTTLVDKVINLAMMQAVDQMVKAVDTHAWNL